MLTEDIKQRIKSIHAKYPEIPVPIVRIVNDEGIKIFETQDFKKNQSGSITKEDDTFIIYVNNLELATRKRFTIAHELGHFIMHKDDLIAGQEMVTETKQPAELSRTIQTQNLTPHQRQQEIEANHFAADLLMPEEAFIEFCNNVNTIEEVANHFKVSISAAATRAVKLGVFFL